MTALPEVRSSLSDLYCRRKTWRGNIFRALPLPKKHIKSSRLTLERPSTPHFGMKLPMTNKEAGRTRGRQMICGGCRIRQNAPTSAKFRLSWSIRPPIRENPVSFCAVLPVNISRRVRQPALLMKFQDAVFICFTPWPGLFREQ